MRTVAAWIAGGVVLAAPGWAQGKAAPPKPAPAKAAALPPINPKLPKETQAALLADRAEPLEKQGKYAEAAALLQQAADLTPEDWALWDRTGWAYLDAAQAEPALKAFENARRQAPPGTPTYGGALVSHFALGHREEVLKLLKQVVPPESLEAATAVVTKGLAAKARTPDWNYALGYLYARVLTASPRGLAPLEAVVQADAKRADAWLLLVELNQAANRGAQEDAAALKYLELAPETVDAYRLRAQRYALQKQDREAFAEYQAGIAKYPAATELYLGEARLHERLGGVKQAEALYRKLVAEAEKGKQEGVQTQARAHLAGFLARQRNYAEAERIYQEAAARPNASGGTWNTWGSLLALNGKWEEAAKALEGAAQRDAKNGGGPAVDQLGERYRAAVCRLAAGQKEAAQTALARLSAPKGEPRTSTHAEIDALLAWMAGRGAEAARLAHQPGDDRWAAFTWRRQPEAGEFEVRGRFSLPATAWRAMLQQVQKKYPDCWAADYALARIYAAGGYTENALSLLNRVTTGRQDWWAPHFALGQYYARERNRDRGVPALTRTLQLAPGCRQAKVYLALLRNVKEDEDE